MAAVVASSDASLKVQGASDDATTTTEIHPRIGKSECNPRWKTCVTPKSLYPPPAPAFQFKRFAYRRNRFGVMLSNVIIAARGADFSDE